METYGISVDALNREDNYKRYLHGTRVGFPSPPRFLEENLCACREYGDIGAACYWLGRMHSKYQDYGEELA